MAKLFRRRKGQSAIEYLTTYGWMLLVIAIVGGAIFSTVQNSAQIQSTSGLSNAGVQISNFGVTDKGLQIELRGAAQNQVENVNLSLVQENSETTGRLYANRTVTIPVGGTKTVYVDEITNSPNTNTFRVSITYDTGGLDGLQVNGTMTGQMTAE